MDIRGVYRFSSLVKQNKKAKFYAVFCFAGKRIFFFNIYDVITWGEKKALLITISDVPNSGYPPRQLINPQQYNFRTSSVVILGGTKSYTPR